MTHIFQKLQNQGLCLGAPPWLSNNIHYLTIVGSHAYGVADTHDRAKVPDYDVYGFAIPPKEMIFTHLNGHIDGFGPEPPKFNQFQNPNIVDPDALGGKGQQWDFSIFNIVRMFELCRQNNPNMIDMLFTPQECVLHCSKIGWLIRDNRHLFLSKECWKKFRGYAYSQMHKMENKNPIGKRKELVEKHGYDVKFAYHVLRLLDEAEQILLVGDLNLQRAKEVMKAIRRGEWTIDQVRQFATEKDKVLEAAYTNCKLPDHPPIEPIKQLLVNCLEEHYGSLEKCIQSTGWAENTLKEIDSKLNEVRKRLYSSN